MGGEFGFPTRPFSGTISRMILGCLVLVNLFLVIEILLPGTIVSLPPKCSSNLIVHVLQVKDGDAILFETPRGRVYCLDGGSDGPIPDHKVPAIVEFLRRKQIRKIDGVVVSHFHNNHVEGLLRVCREFSVGKIWTNGTQSETMGYQAIKSLAALRRIPMIPVEFGETLDWGDELGVLVLGPTAEQRKNGKDQNHCSISLLVRYGQVGAFFPADLPAESQAVLQKQYGKNLEFQIFKVPQQGAKTAFCEEFWGGCPLNELFILSVGKDNAYGYPDPVVWEWLKKSGRTVLRTDQNGNVEVQIGGKTPKDFSWRIDRSS